jgi:hypothetical protein
MVSRSKVINKIIENNGYKTYLEIGVSDGSNFNRIIIDEKEGIDPKGNCKYKITSDTFFKNIDTNKKWDLVFIDGLHLKDQVLKDVDNSLKHLNNNGMIIIHDANPRSEKESTENKTPSWFGTVWKAIVHMRMNYENITMKTIGTDCGLCVIKNGKQNLFPKQEINWKLLEDNKKEILNLVSVFDFFGENI